MKRLICFCLLSVFQFFFAQNSPIDVQHYRFSIDLKDDNDTIKGKATIVFKTLQSAENIVLDLASRNDSGKGMMVDKIDSDKKISFNQSNDLLSIHYPEKLDQGKIDSVTVYYQGIPSDGLIISNNKFGDRTFFSDNWPNRAHQWIPCKDDPSDKASVEFIVTAPQHYKIISNGLLQEEKEISDHLKRTHWKEEVQLPTKVMVIGAADFNVFSLTSVKDIPVTAWAFEETQNQSVGDYGFAPEILEYFIRYIGPYGYKKLANVESKTIFGGMENASCIFYFEDSVNGKKDHEDLLAHEIAHQWFGNMVTEKAFSHIWLSEGFATYFTHIYLEQKYGQQIMTERMQQDRNKVIAFVARRQVPIVDTTTPLMQLINTNSYQKGGWILHMLRNEIGDDIFHKAIQNYYQQFAGGNADTEDFQKVVEKESGKNLDVFFKQWLYRPGIPTISKNWNYNAKRKELTLNLSQKQEMPFVFPLEILVKTSDGKEIRKTLEVKNSEEHFHFKIKSSVSDIQLDPETKLLFQEV